MPALTVLADNTPAPPLDGEHGLAFAVELLDGRLWLWDAGQSALAATNAKAMGFHLATAEGVALSHGHYDHAGGLPAYREAGCLAPLHAHPAATRPRWAVRPGETPRAIGWLLPGQTPPPFHPVRGACVLAREGLHGRPLLAMVTDIPRRPGAVTHVADFFCDPEAETADDVPDDACLLLQVSPNDAVLALGCCHSGLENTVRAAEAAMASLGMGPRLAGIAGGMHLMRGESLQLESGLEVLHACATRHPGMRLAPCHCTGQAATSAMQAALDATPCTVTPLRVGARLDWPA